MAKRKSRRKIIPNPNAEYSPRLSPEEKAANHRKSSAKYYARNPEIRERRRIQMAEKSATVKLNRRRWDPPNKRRLAKGQPSHASLEIELAGCAVACTNGRSPDSGFDHFYQSPARSELSYHDGDGSDVRVAVMASDSTATPSHEPSFWDPRARSDINLNFSPVQESEQGVVGTAASPTSDERIASQALAALAQTVALPALAPPRASSKNSILEDAMQFSALESSIAAVPLPLQSNFPTDAAALNFLSPVQVAILQVAARNSGPLAMPTEEDAAAWRMRPYLGGGGVDEDMHRAITVWRLGVCKAHRRARMHGYESVARWTHRVNLIPYLLLSFNWYIFHL
ncbi:hypothetical protein B0H11DRAFT_2253099 [Mycena galericulata]|nr:hypothetical protein B0H11DRAFT_2253099 [Mycena galericulata]